MKEKTLSEKVRIRNSINYKGTRMNKFIYVGDVKQFIKELKEFIKDKTYKREAGEIIRFMPFEFKEFLTEKVGDLK